MHKFLPLILLKNKIFHYIITYIIISFKSCLHVNNENKHWLRSFILKYCREDDLSPTLCREDVICRFRRLQVWGEGRLPASLETHCSLSCHLRSRSRQNLKKKNIWKINILNPICWYRYRVSSRFWRLSLSTMLIISSISASPTWSIELLPTWILLKFSYISWEVTEHILNRIIKIKLFSLLRPSVHQQECSHHRPYWILWKFPDNRHHLQISYYYKLKCWAIIKLDFTVWHKSRMFFLVMKLRIKFFILKNILKLFS